MMTRKEVAVIERKILDNGQETGCSHRKQNVGRWLRNRLQSHRKEDVGQWPTNRLRSHRKEDVSCETNNMQHQMKREDDHEW
jgi:hypothetical protein